MKRLRQIMVGLLACILLIPTGHMVAQAQDVTAFWEMDVPPEEGWKVGDRIPLRLRVISPASTVAVLPELPEQWGTFEVRDQSLAPLEKKGDRVIAVLAISVQLWETGIHETPPTTL